MQCNGAAFDKSQFPELAATYPSGVLPDLRGEFIRGWDDGRGVDSGRGILSWQTDEFKSHNHTFPLYHGSGNGRDVIAALRTLAVSSREITHTASNSGGVETRPRNIAFNYIVRAA
ncbi:phage tail protein [Photorhabdus temperata]|uniref:phage tail protein n=1 Tax=Photorhabdus temperata TaxID=574560 RepID=UPI001E2C9C61